MNRSSIFPCVPWATSLCLAGAVAAFMSAAFGATEAKKVTYEDDVLPIFRDNCLKCHNPDKLKGDLDLTSFSGAVKGGGSGVTLNAGDPDGSQLFKSITHTDEPAMPPNSKLAERDILTIRKWIEGGMLQGAGSKALAASKPAVDLGLKSVSIGRPEGPPPMPQALSLEPFAVAARGTALTAVVNSPWAPIVALSGAKQIVFYDTNTLEFLGVLPFPEGFPCDVKFSRNGKLLIVGGGRGGQSGLVTVWDITTGERVITIGEQFDSVLATDISSDQRWIALGGPDRVLKIYDTRDGSLVHRIKKHTEWITAAEFSPDSKYLATGDRNGGLVLWETESGQEMFNLPGHKGAITAVSWRGDSEMFLSASEDGTLKFWKAIDGAALKNITAHPGGALAAQFTRDARIVSSGRDNKVQLWDVTGKNLRTLPFDGDLPNRVTFSDDGSKVIGSDWKGRVIVWDAKSAKVLGDLNPNPPTLRDRVQQGTEQLAAAKAELDAAVAAVAAAEKLWKSRQASVAKLKQALASARPAPTTNEASADPESSRRIAEIEKQISDATKQAGVAATSLATAKSKAEELTAKVAAAKSTLAKWQAAQKGAASKPVQTRVTLR
jgi:hypothetical protein